MNTKTRAGHARKQGRNGDRKAIVAFVVFCAAAVLLGGASRPDEFANALLRPVAIILGAFALWNWPGGRPERGVPIIAALLGLAVLCALQLVPLPPALWMSLPGRDVVIALDGLLFEQEPWRPLTVSPAGTWNTLFFLCGLTGGLLTFLLLDRRRDVLVLQIFVAIAIASVLLALVQAQGGTDALPLYAKTSNGPTGLFSNANHFGIFCGIGMLIAADLARRDRLLAGRQARWFVFVAIAILMMAGALISSSRLAFGSATLALICSSLVFARDISLFKGAGARSRKPAVNRKVAGIAFAVVIAAFAGFFVYFSLLARDAGMGTFEEAGLAENLRFRITPILAELASRHWLFGIGFGSFADFYATIEPSELMGPQYVNHAHNDFFQVLIEGGIAAAIIAIGLCSWLGWRLLVLFRGGNATRGVLVAGLFGIIVFASVFDYVLRTPLLAFVVACLAIIWTSQAEEQKQG